MYCDFFGLHTPPFNNTPDPRFFFNTPEHEEALATLIFAAQQRKGFVVVTGEVGSGKTLLTRLLTARLGPTLRIAFVTNARRSPRELLHEICRGFDLEVSADAPTAELAHALREFLLQQYARDRIVVVAVDEAQMLPPESFEELRLLGNLEADDAKLLQVFFFGHSELHHILRRSNLQHLRQRLFRSLHLSAFTSELTAAYIRHRLEAAGLSDGRELFTPDALEAIHRHAEGIPRLINHICDNVLLAAYTRSETIVTAALVDTIVRQLDVRTVPVSSGSASVSRDDLRQREDSSSRRSRGDHMSDTTSAADEIEVLRNEIRELRAVRRAADEDAESLRRRTAEMHDELRRATQEAQRQSAEMRQMIEAVKSAPSPPDSESQAETHLVTVEQQEQVAAAMIERLVGGVQQRIAAEIEQQMFLVQAKMQQFHEIADGLRSSFDAAADAARRSITKARDEAEQTIQARTATLTETLHAELSNAASRSEAMRAEAKTFTTELGDRLRQARQKLLALIEDAHQTAQLARIESKSAGDAIRIEAKGALEALRGEAKAARETMRKESSERLEEVRTMLLQMNDRAGTIRADLVRLSDNVQTTAQEAAEGQQRSAVAIFNQLDALRQTIKDDAAAHHDRLVTARREADQAVTKLQQSAAELLARAGDVFTRTSDTATKLTEKAEQVLTDVRTAADQIVQRIEATADQAQTTTQSVVRDARSMAEAAIARAEQAMEKSEAMAHKFTDELQTIRHRAVQEAELSREQIHAARLLLIEQRDESARTMNEIRESCEKTREEIETLLRRTEEAQQSTQALIDLPRELIDEAGRRAAGLAQLSKKTSEIVQRLTESSNGIEDRITAAASHAEQTRIRVEQVAGEADKRIEVLRQQTARVGQLVGIVRQLYGSLDARARIQQIRSRLDQADELCRGVVPREMEQLRAVLADQITAPHTLEGGAQAAASLRVQQAVAVANRPSTTATRQQTTRRRDAEKSQKQAVGSTPAASKTSTGTATNTATQLTLGQIVARNQKLNQWLKQTLGDDVSEQSPAPNPASDRTGSTSTTPRSVPDTPTTVAKSA